jgi:hypothetical protein
LEYKPVNLGQGFPDFAAPDYVRKALDDVVTGPDVLLHQYTRGFVRSLVLFSSIDIFFSRSRQTRDE